MKAQLACAQIVRLCRAGPGVHPDCKVLDSAKVLPEAKENFRPPDVNCPSPYVFFRRLGFSGWVDACAPITLASTLSNACCLVISLLPLLCLYLCSKSQVRQRVTSTS